jgi:hypothetical protein
MSLNNFMAAQNDVEVLAFVEAFAKLNITFIQRELTELVTFSIGDIPALDWDCSDRLTLSGISSGKINETVRSGIRYLHIDLAVDKDAGQAKKFFLLSTGLSEKLQRSIFPELYANRVSDIEALSKEVIRLNSWLDSVRQNDFDPMKFFQYQQCLAIHGRTQNLSGTIGAIGATVAFFDAIQSLCSSSIASMDGELPPPTMRSPAQIYEWSHVGKNKPAKAILLHNGRALVFSSSKDVNIFQPLGAPFESAQDALLRFNKVRNDQKARNQVIHEFAVGEVKTATDANNLHERMGLASRETQTELRTDRFLMMSILNRKILEGGVQKRVMNNRDLTRFSQVFNLHHCWGWDGGRERNREHWNDFLLHVKAWCDPKPPLSL